MAVKPIPDGYRSVTPFMNVKGCAEAIELYKKALGAEAKERMTTPSGAIMHTEIQIGDSRIMMSDAMMVPPTTSSFHLYVSDCDAAFKRAVDAGMTPTMPPADQFWGDRYSVVHDKFGNRWSFATHKEDLTPEQMKKRAEDFIAQQAKK